MKTEIDFDDFVGDLSQFGGSANSILSTEFEIPKLPEPRDPEETSSDATCVEMDELASVIDYLSDKEEESGEELELTSMTISHDYTTFDENKVEKEVEVTFERTIEPHKKSKVDQSLVLVRPSTLACIQVEFYIKVEEKEHSKIFYTVDTFVMDGPDEPETYMLEIIDELQILNERMPISFSKTRVKPFVGYHSQTVRVT
ncbi:hypothetical protein Scep_004639 [Stephania cephalantha]|uniref:Uncharacterized protein n=1 Tax=Stephania cephalantha TaxID=152367 RepID=A0AAP0PWT7_9MAGN